MRTTVGPKVRYICASPCLGQISASDAYLYHVIAASDETLSQLIGSSLGRLAHCTVSHMPALERDFLRRVCASV